MTTEEWISSAESGWVPVPLALQTPDLVEELVNRGMSCIRQDLDLARLLAKHALRVARKVKCNRSLGLAFRLNGHVDLLGGRSRAALKSYVSARGCFSHLPEDRAATAIAMLQALAYVGEYGQAFEIATEALTYYQSTGDQLRAARVEANLGNTLHRLDRLTEAKDCFMRSLAVLTESGDSSDLAIVMRNFAVVLMGLQDYCAAEQMYTDARKRFDPTIEFSLILEIDLNRAYLLGRQGRIREALVMYRELQDKLPNARGFELGHCFLDQADLMLEVGLWSDAETAAKMAAQVFEGLGARFELGKARLFEGMALMRKGHTLEARVRLSEGSKLLRRDSNRVWYAMARHAQGEVFEMLGWKRKAIRELRAAEEASVGSERAIPIRSRLCELLLDAGAMDEAAVRLRDINRSDLEAKYYRVTGNAIMASEKAKFALEQYDRRRKSLSAMGLRKANAAANESMLRECARAIRDPRQRCLVSSRLKNQALCDLLATPEAVAATCSASLLRRQMLDSELPGGQLETALAKEVHESQIFIESRALTEIEVPKLARGVRFVEVFVEDRCLRAFLIEGDTISEINLGLLKDFEVEARRFRLALGIDYADPVGDRIRDRLAWFGDRLAVLFQGSPQKVIIAADGPLRCLPIHAITIDGSPLLDSAEVGYAPSASIYAALLQRPRIPGEGLALLAAADSLAPEIDLEARLIVDIMGGEHALTVENFQAEAVSARFIHIAAHGMTREDQPLLTAMKLQNRSWTVFDVLQQPLCADLTTLSGCGTGLSVLGNALDSQGFIEAYLAAGSSAVLASLWDVSDSITRTWMESFYRELAQGEVNEAYRSACASIRSSYPNPAHWAPFALFGLF